jgi:hypothetical protein
LRRSAAALARVDSDIAVQHSCRPASAGGAPASATWSYTRHAYEHATPLSPLTTVRHRPASDIGDVNPFMLAGHAVIEGGQQVSAEMLAFWQSRLKDAVATGRRLLECASAQDAWKIQLEYTQSALQAYVDQSAKVARLVTHTLTDSLLPHAPGAAPTGATTRLAA